MARLKGAAPAIRLIRGPSAIIGRGVYCASGAVFPPT